MKHVSILIPQGHFSVINIEATHQILNWVNLYCQQVGREPVFHVQLVGTEKATTQSTGLFTVHPDAMMKDIEKTGVVFIPAIFGDAIHNKKINEDAADWVLKQYNKGADIASMCYGSFFLASIGLLNGRACSTHWEGADRFQHQFPAAELVDERIVVEANGVYTSGGAFSFTNLIIYLIEKYAGKELAVAASKAFMIDYDRSNQSQFRIFVGQKEHEDEQILKAQQYIEEHFKERIAVQELCEQLGVGRRSFERRFKYATSNTVVEYIQRVKIEAAKKGLETGRKTVNEVMYDVGYSDTKAFRNIFKKHTGITPVAYRNKYNREIAYPSEEMTSKERAYYA